MRFVEHLQLDGLYHGEMTGISLFYEALRPIIELDIAIMSEKERNIGRDDC